MVEIGVNANYDAAQLAAILPLLEAEKIHCFEWSFDTLFQQKEVPDWFDELLQTYSDGNALIAHGVFYSLFSGRFSSQQQNWLLELKEISKKYTFQHLTEHFGFFSGKDFHTGAPLPVPLTSTTLSLGQDRLKRLQEAANCPVGLENLAFSFSLEEVKKHGDFLHQLLEPVNGFILLDAHNLYCQIHNFEIVFEDLIALYPLERVREIHLSGGSWQKDTVFKDIRRDTHDGNVPEEVFEILEKLLPLCPNVKYVILEQMGSALQMEEEKKQFRSDYVRIEKIVKESILNKSNTFPFMPFQHSLSKQPLENEPLYAEQRILAHILENSTSYENAKQELSKSILANSYWKVESWSDELIFTAMNISKKWKDGW